MTPAQKRAPTQPITIPAAPVRPLTPWRTTNSLLAMWACPDERRLKQAYQKVNRVYRKLKIVVVEP